MSYNYQPYQDDKMATSSSYAIDMPTDRGAKEPLNPSSSYSRRAATTTATGRPESIYVARNTSGGRTMDTYDDQDDLITPRFKDILKIFFFGLLPCSIPGIAIVVLGTVFKKDWKILGIRLVHWGIYAEIFLITFWIGLLIIKVIPFILKPFFSTGARKYLRIFQNLEIAYALCVWAVACWITFYPTMHFAQTGKKPPAWANTVHSILLADCVAAIIYSAKCCLVQFVGYRYHKTQFAGKKAELKAKINTLERLYAVRNGPLSSKHGVNRHDHDLVLEALERFSTAEDFAQRLYLSLVTQGENALLPTDFDHIDTNAFHLLDADNNGSVTREELINFVINVCRNRRDLITGQTDIRSTLNAFDWLMLCVMLILDVFVYIAFINNSFRMVFGFGGTLLAGSGFAFAGTIQDLMASIIFVFVKHPYDVGDRVLFDGQSYIVMHISLMYSIFRATNDDKNAQASNSVLNTKTIDNISRSETVNETFRLGINVKTPPEDLVTLRELLDEYLDEHSREYHKNSLTIKIQSFTLERCDIVIAIRYKVKWTDEERYEELRHNFQAAMIAAFLKIPIGKPSNRPPGIPKEGQAGNAQYTVEISREEAVMFNKEAIEKSAAKKYRGRAAEKTDVGSPKEK